MGIKRDNLTVSDSDSGTCQLMVVDYVVAVFKLPSFNLPTSDYTCELDIVLVSYKYRASIHFLS